LSHSERPKRVDVDLRGNGWVAQLAEQWTENPRVGGSIPPPATFSPRYSGIDFQGLFSAAYSLVGKG